MSPDPYDRPSDPAKRQSAALTDGPARAGARAMLKGTGFSDEDLAKPIVGVGTTWIETMPCNLNQRDLAVHVKRGVRDAGGTPMECQREVPAALRAQFQACPLWVISGLERAHPRCPLFPRKRTCSASTSMSAKCQ